MNMKLYSIKGVMKTKGKLRKNNGEKNLIINTCEELEREKIVKSRQIRR